MTYSKLLAVLTLIFSVFCAAPSVGFGQGTGELIGRVTSAAGDSLPGANVVLDGTQLGAAAGTDGRYRIENIPSGRYTLVVSFVGFERKRIPDVRIRAGETTRRDIELREEALQARQITVTVGSRAAHTAADELAVPVDVYGPEQLEVTGTTETALILQQVSPSINFPRQTVADGMDALRPFTLRGLSPDHTLVLINGKRRHRSALVNRLGSGIPKGSSTVDLNAIPSSAILGIEVLRDGAAAQYGSDAIAGVVNIQLKNDPVPLTVGAQLGGHVSEGFQRDGTSYNINAAYGIPVGDEGFINVFGELRFRDPTNRAGPDPRDQVAAGDGDIVQDIDGDNANEVIEKNNPVPQPSFHWGNGASDNYYLWTNSAIPIGNRDTATPTEIYAFGGYSYRDALGQGFYRRAMGNRNWPSIYPLGFLPEFDIKINDYSGSVGLRGLLGDWNYDLNAQTGYNGFEYNIANSLNVTLGPNSNKTRFYAGTVSLRQSSTQLDVRNTYEVGLAGPLNVAAGAIFRIDEYQIEAGERASWVDGPVKTNQNGGRAAPGAQVFPGFRPSQAVDESRSNVGVYLDLEADLTDRLLANVAGRFERYSDFGSTVNGKLALRYQAQENLVFRAAAGTGFRAPNLAQRYFSKISTTFIDNVPFEVGLFPNDSQVANALGVPELTEERAVNLSGGFALSPSDKLTFTTDVFYARIYDRIILSGNLGGPRIEDLVGQFGAQRVQVFSNAIDTDTWGMDLTADYRTPVGNDAVLTLTGSFNFTRNAVVSDIATPTRLDETFDASIFGREARLELTKERPESTTKLSVTYEEGPFRVNVRGTRYGQVLVPDDTPQEDFTLSPETVISMEVAYDIVPDYATLSVGARNLLDNYPDPTPPGENFNGIFPFPTASPFGFNGRFVYTRISVQL
ncbi:TonB-dependent receptor [Salisaeta longa]|uniref:TonB-dependent receptor n=1 Tax=Salisaeta longa TaxID=503170 RepID=UPI0003B4BA4A|nr:TonB-dependent receptor [Salisaeta longa]